MVEIIQGPLTPAKSSFPVSIINADADFNHQNDGQQIIEKVDVNLTANHLMYKRKRYEWAFLAGFINTTFIGNQLLLFVL